MIPAELVTLRDFLRWAVSRFNEAGLFLVVGVLRAMAEEQAGFVEAADRPAQKVAQRDQLGGNHVSSSSRQRS